MKNILLIWAFFFSIAVSAEETAKTETYQVGSQLTAFSLNDQFDKKHSVDENTKLIMFSKDMDGNKVLKEALKGKNGDYLTQKNVAYVNDISGMPAIITFLFAKRKMRGYDYPMLLDDTPSATKNFPAEEEQATLIHLDQLKIKSIQFTKKPDDVVKALEALN